MTKFIYKYPLQITDHQLVKMPLDSDVLSVDEHRGQLCLWAMVDPQSRDVIQRRIEIIGTGNPIPELQSIFRRQFIGTVVMDPFVWHVFEHVLIDA